MALKMSKPLPIKAFVFLTFSLLISINYLKFNTAILMQPYSPFRLRLSFAISLCLLYAPLFAQSTFLPLESQSYHTIDRIEIKTAQLSDYVHTSVKPYTRLDAVLHNEAADEAQYANFVKTDRQYQYYTYKESSEWSDFGLIESKHPLFKHIYRYKTDFLHLSQYSDFMLKINPVLYWQIGKDFNAPDIRYINTRGVEMRGLVSEKLGFYAYLGENQAAFPQYIEQRINSTLAVPGEARYKEFNSRIGNGFFAPGQDYMTLKGYITFQPIERIRVQFGHDKNFIGNGIRSLLLSDFSNNYLFLKFNTQVWRFNYQNLFMQLTGQYNTLGDSILPKKFAAIHHLSFNATKWLNIGLFESVVYGRSNNQFELAYLNPLIFYRAAEFQLGSPDNVILGLNYKANFARHFSLYGQFVVDEFKFDEIKSRSGWWANKVGMQVGLKYIDVAGITNLDAQIEYNSVRPYTYSHNNTDGNYTHYNQPLAHPLGANFREVLGVLRYRTYNNMQFKLNLMYAQQGLDSDTSNWGGNIFLSNNTHQQDYGNKLLQGIKNSTLLTDFVWSVMWKHNLWFDVNTTLRQKKNDIGQTSTSAYVGCGMRLNIGRREMFF